MALAPPERQYTLRTFRRNFRSGVRLAPAGRAAYRPHVPEPTVGRALGAGFRAVAGEAWLVVLGLCVALSRGLLALPGTAFVVAVSWLAAREALHRGGGLPGVVAVLAQAWSTPRFRSIAIGLWLGGLLLWGALRVAWVAGAAPLVAWRLSGASGPPPAFAEAAARRFHQVLPAALAALLLDLLGKAMVLSALLGVVVVGSKAQGSGSAGPAAFVAALAVAAAALLATSLSALGDVAVARAAIAGEDVLRSLGRGLASFLSRPAAFLVVLLAVWLGTVLASGSVQGALGVLGSAAHGGPRWLAVVPDALLAVLGALLAAGAELWRLAAVGVLSLADQSGEEKRWMSLRSDRFGIRPPSQ